MELSLENNGSHGLQVRVGGGSASADSGARPCRPGRLEERLSSWLFLALSPRLEKVESLEVPRRLAPWEERRIERRGRSGTLAAMWFPAVGEARGAVLLLHPWVCWGQAYLQRRGRLEALRAAGYHCLTVDLGGFGASARGAGFFDLDVADALAYLRSVSEGLPIHLWGISAGGYWAHPVLSRGEGVAGAVFEDVSPHFLEWSGRMAPWGRPGYAFFRRFFARSYRFIDLRLHAPQLRVGAVAYMAGGADLGIPVEETRELARLAGAKSMIVDGAAHLESIKRSKAEVIALALSTFDKAEAWAEWVRPAQPVAAPVLASA